MYLNGAFHILIKIFVLLNFEVQTHRLTFTATLKKHYPFLKSQMFRFMSSCWCLTPFQNLLPSGYRRRYLQFWAGAILPDNIVVLPILIHVSPIGLRNYEPFSQSVVPVFQGILTTFIQQPKTKKPLILISLRSCSAWLSTNLSKDISS